MIAGAMLARFSRSAWLVLAVVAGCRGQRQAEPPALVDGVTISARHRELVESRVACVSRHGGLEPGEWRVEDSGIVVRVFGGGEEPSYVAMTVTTDARGVAEARGFRLWLHDGRVAFEFDGGAGRAAFLDERAERALFWVDLGGEDPFAPLRDVEAARAAAHAVIAAHGRDRERAMELADARWCGRIRCERRTLQVRDRRSDVRDALADDVAARHALVDRHVAELIAGVRRLYPIDDPACRLPLGP